MLIKFDGSNGEAIASALNEARTKSRMEVAVNTEHSGPSLSLNRVWVPDKGAVDMDDRRLSTEVFEDSWRVPVGFSIQTDTGEVFDGDGRLWAHEDLVEL